MPKCDTREPAEEGYKAMPKLGEIRRRRRISNPKNYLYDVWTGCPECSRERWSPKDSRRGLYRLCKRCSGIKSAQSPKRQPKPRYTNEGYIRIYFRDPNTDRKYWVYEHRLIMERKLGRQLLPYERVHHINGIKDDNREENLMLVSPSNHNLREAFCRDCPLKKEVRLLRWELKQMKEALQLKLGNL